MFMNAAERIGQALRCMAPDENRTGWVAGEALDLDVTEKTFRSWFLGHSAPDADNLLLLFERYGRAFIDAYLEPIGYRVTSDDQQRAIDESIETIERAHLLIGRTREMLVRRQVVSDGQGGDE